MTEAKGLILEVYRNPLYRCRLNVLDTFNSVTLVRIVQDERWRIPGEEPPSLGRDCEVFAPTAERPAVELAWRVMNGKPCHYIRPLR